MDKKCCTFIFIVSGEDIEIMRLEGTLLEAQSKAREYTNENQAIVDIFKESGNGNEWIDKIYPDEYSK